MRFEIKLTVVYIEVDDISQFRLEATNGTTSGALEFWAYLDYFRDFGKRLISFPQTINDVVADELGENGEQSAYYMLLKVFCYEANGASAVYIKMDDHQLAPDTNKAEFFIKTDPASINKFGELLLHWDPTKVEQIVWSDRWEWDRS
jgi:hypothetical protein